jgi:hypothetical protein
MQDALTGWSRAALARVTSKAVAAISGGRGPKIVARDFRVWKLRGERAEGLLDFELTIALPGGAERTFWGFNWPSSFEPAQTVEEASVILARDVMETLDVAPQLEALIAAVTATVEEAIRDLGYAELGVELITVRPRKLMMENLCEPEAVTVVALMRDPHLDLVLTEFDAESAAEARQLLEDFLPEERERSARASMFTPAAYVAE